MNFRKFLVHILTLFQLIPLVEGWISYCLGSIIASLFSVLSFFSLLWYPLDLLFKYMWIGCDYLKQKLLGHGFSMQDSSNRWQKQFPVF